MGAGQKGFTLIEFLVAVVVVGLALGVTIQAVLEQGRATERLAQGGEVALCAQRNMARLMGQPFLAAGVYHGEDVGGVAWRATVRRLSPEPPRDPAARRGGQRRARPTAVLLEISLCADKKGAGRLCLASQRLAVR